MVQRVVRNESKVAMEQHLLGKGGSQRIGLNVEVTEHFVGVPVAQEMNLIGVNFSTKEGHGTAGAERSGGDVFGAEAEYRSNGGDGNAEGSCDEGGCNVEPCGAIARAAEAHKFAKHPILLSGELQGDEGGGV